MTFIWKTTRRISLANWYNTILFECPVPFYLRGQDCSSPVLLGIQANRFTYVELNEEPWLLFDKFVDSAVNINMVNADEYVYIQLDLKRQLQSLIQKKTNDYFPVNRNTCFENYLGIVLGGEAIISITCLND